MIVAGWIVEHEPPAALLDAEDHRLPQGKCCQALLDDGARGLAREESIDEDRIFGLPRQRCPAENEEEDGGQKGTDSPADGWLHNRWLVLARVYVIPADCSDEEADEVLSA
jgi:hypothetical protein